MRYSDRRINYGECMPVAMPWQRLHYRERMPCATNPNIELGEYGGVRFHSRIQT
jgi:hypothetical protein